MDELNVTLVEWIGEKDTVMKLKRLWNKENGDNQLNDFKN